MLAKPNALAILPVILASVIGALACGGGNGTGGSGGKATGGTGGHGGTAPTLVAEAGYVEVPKATSVGPQYKARMFYSFHPADAEPEKKPLLLFFNGGPGAATSGILMVYGTGPMTLDADADVMAPPSSNPSSFNRFANVLYLDERMTGFSYGLGTNGCSQGTTEYVEDAGDFVYSLLDFLDAHEALRKNPVVLVGESYGGTRAPMMLFELQQYAGPPAVTADGLPDLPSRLPWLVQKVQAHFDLVDPSTQGVPRTPAQVATQFGWEALIQPNFFGATQIQIEQTARQTDPDFAAYNANPMAYDQYDIRKPPQYDDDLSTRAAHTMRDPMLLESVLGVSPAGVKGLSAADRTDAFRVIDSSYDIPTIRTEEAAMSAALGALPPNDVYWLPQEGTACANQTGDIGSANALLLGFHQTHVFVTNAHWDAAVYTKALPQILAMTAYQVSVDETLPAGAARPGVIVMKGATDQVDIRFPSYEAGHTVTTATPKELGDDLQAWLEATGAIQ